MGYRWDELLTRTEGLQKSAVLRKFFGAPPIREEELLDIFRQVSSRYTGELLSTLRAYQGGRREELEHRALSTPPSAGANLKMWFEEVFTGLPAALILNRAERYSARVANLAASFNYALSGGEPHMLYDVECVLLIGDYGYSPFGVHLDYGTTRVVHIPLTAEPKTMLLWTEAEFVNATCGRTPCFNLDPLLPSAERHSFSAGDVFYLSSDRYHVGHSSRLTATLAVVLTQHNQSPQLSQLSAALSATFGPNWAETDMVRQLRVHELCQLERTHASLRRLSNVGLCSEVELDGDSLPSDADQMLRVVRPFRFMYSEQFGLTVYVRGTSFSLPAGTDKRHVRSICELLEILNTGESLSVNIAARIARTLSHDAIAYLFDLFARRHAIEAVPPDFALG